MIAENLSAVRQRLTAACLRAGRDRRSITLVAVTKGRSAGQIKEAICAGIRDIGENKIQEAAPKYKELAGLSVNWHMVGHLQTNKAREAVRIFTLIHSVDSVRLAAEINKQAAKLKKVQDILVEVNTSGEAAKFGVKADAAPEIIKEISGLGNIKIRGLMTIAPIVNKPQDARPYFRRLKVLRDQINHLRLTTYDLPLLSMGMSDDFEAAIEEGSNMLRLGRVIFEQR